MSDSGEAPSASVSPPHGDLDNTVEDSSMAQLDDDELEAHPGENDDDDEEEGVVLDAFGLADAAVDEAVVTLPAAQALAEREQKAGSQIDSPAAAKQVDTPDNAQKAKEVEDEGEEREEGELEEGEIDDEPSAPPSRQTPEPNQRKRPRASDNGDHSSYYPPPGASYAEAPMYPYHASMQHAAPLPRSRSANAAFYDHHANPASYGYHPADYPPAPGGYYDPRMGPAPLPMPDYSRSDGDAIRPPDHARPVNRSKSSASQSADPSAGSSRSNKRRNQGDRAVPDVPFGRAAETTPDSAPSSSKVPANASVIAPVSTLETQKALASLPQLPTTVTRLTAFAPGITAAVSGGRIIKTLSYTPADDQGSEATVKAVYKSLDAGTGQPGILPLSDEDKLARLPSKLATIFSYHMTPESASKPELFAPAKDVDLSGVEHLPEPVETTLHGWWPCSNTALLDKDGTMAALAKAAASTGAPLDDRPHIEIFVDNSNILYSFLNWARRRPEAKITTYTNNVNGKTKITKAVTLNNKKVRMDYRILFGILERGRKVFKRVMAGSSPLWQSLAPAIQWGYEISILQRVPRPPDSKSKPAAVIAADAEKAGKDKKRQGSATVNPSARKAGPEADENNSKHYKEQGVDEVLHLKILETLMDYSPSTNASKTRPVLVLATGDANSSEYNPTGFLGCVRRALALGWDVELMSFPEGLASTWIGEQARATLEHENNEKYGILRIIDLEVFAEEMVSI